MGEYNPENHTYAVSVDISVDRQNKETEQYFRIDKTDSLNGTIRVSYHTVWGGMAPNEDRINSIVFSGDVLLDPEDGYRVLGVKVTEDNSDQ
jgi:hypothetical protein